MATIALSAPMLGGAFAGPAQAATVAAPPPAEGTSATAPEAITLEPASGSLFHQVDNAPTTAEKIRLLEDAGFTAKGAGLAYEKTEGGLTLGYVVADPVSAGGGKQAGTDARVGWDADGPYVVATWGQWKQLATDGSVFGAAACGLITATFGSAACAAAAGVVINRISQVGSSEADDICMKLNGKSPVFLLEPWSGAC